MRSVSHDRSHLAPLDLPSGRASRVHLPPQGGKGVPASARRGGGRRRPNLEATFLILWAGEAPLVISARFA
jgi:hypothetical protein